MYLNAAGRVLRSQNRLTGAHPRWFVWQEVAITQVVKKRGGKRGQIERVLAQGEGAPAERLRQHSGGGMRINSAFIEWLNASFRQRVTPLARRSC
jgi:hypothetical protein